MHYLLDKIVTATNTFIEHPRWCVSVTLLVFVLLHLYGINSPPNGYHAWRESDTAAVIENYYQEDFSFLKPRINQRGATSGITGMELPMYNYTAAILYFLVGPTHIVPRSLTLLCASLTLLLLYTVAKTILGKHVALFSVWSMAFSPLFFFYSYKIMPDIMMLMFWLGAVFLYLRYDQTDRLLYWIGSAVCLTLSASIKPLGLSVFLVCIFLWWRKPSRTVTQTILLACYIVLTILLTGVWFLYARCVNDIHQSAGFYLGEQLHEFYRFLFTRQFFKKLFLQWPFELWVGWTMVPACIFGCFRAIRDKSAAILLILIVSSYAVFTITAMHSATHDYYTLLIVPPLAVLTGLGLTRLNQGNTWQRILVIVLLVIAPIGACIRLASRFGEISDFNPIRQATTATIDETSLVMVEDPTTAIRLYQMNRRGWPLRFEITYEIVKRYAQQGANYLVLEQPLENYDDSIALLVVNEPVHLGRLYGYKVKEFH